ncbi:MAG: pyrimidine-nucleoside phosphorylase [Oscillospiraceae bacterium]|nr:pyrimidine-nucleoside phosphorylase [Oscillospiraceae bacterium]
MRMYDIIYKKRKGCELSDDEIRFAVNGFTDGTIPDYQMSALAMAICFNSMTDRETATLTSAMAKSGDTVDLSEFGELSVDKHSTGGVGDKTTLIVAPIVAACGAKVAKMSGRGLGHTGGTVDKLESIKGYKTETTVEDFFKQTRDIGVSVIGQTGNMTPADKKLYALRDVTATVDSIPLIVSSIMSKKLAAGAKSIVLDVKVGSGAFMPDLESATVLAEKMVEIGKHCGRNMAALITNMDVPLGCAVGNSLEVIEAISVLKGETVGDLKEICLALSANMVALCYKISYEEAYAKALHALESGLAYNKFKEWIAYQGGDESWIDDTSLFPKAGFIYEVKAKESGWIKAMNTATIGNVSSLLGAGRVTKTDVIDFSAGIELNKKTGDFVNAGETLCTLYTNKEEVISNAEQLYLSSLTFSNMAVPKPDLIYKTII